MTQNMVFAFPNFADAGYYQPVLSGGSWSAALPLSNLQDRLLSKKARSADAAAASTRLHADLQVPRDVRLLSLHAHNLSRSARVRFRATQQAAWGGVTLAAAAIAGATSLSVQCPGGTAMIRAGDTFRLGTQVLRATSDLAIGGNRYANTEAAGAGFSPINTTLAAAAVTAPDGTATATRVTESTDPAAAHGFFRGSPSDSLPVGLPDELSLFFLPAERTRVQFSVSVYNPALAGYSTITATVDLTGAGAVLAAALSGVSLLQLNGVTVEARPDGWYRVRIGMTATAPNNTVSDAIYLVDAAGNAAYTGDGASGLYIWAPQRETQSPGSVYKRSGASPASTVTSGTITVDAALSAPQSAGAALACLCGEYASTAPALDSGWNDLWPVIYGWYLDWENPSFWDGRLTEEERQGYPKNYHYLHPAAATARYALVEIDDALNADGYVELGRLFVARVVQPTKNFAYDTALGWQDDSAVKPTLGGAEFYDPRAPRRVLAGKIEHLPADEAYQDFYEMFRTLGKTGQVYVILDPDEVTHRQRQAMLATFADLQPLPNTSFNRHTAFFNLKEVIA